MQAMILAAGRGERMGVLTAARPKPLLEAGGRPLIEHLIARLRQQGFRDLVVNHAWLGEQIVARLGQGAHLGVRIRYSPEPPGALGTGGGIRAALPLLGSAPFLVANGDLYTDFPFATLAGRDVELAHLVLVPNPAHHPRGDFVLDGDRAREQGEPRCTYAGIAVLRPELLAAESPGRFELAPVLRRAMAVGQIGAELFHGTWIDVGTPARLAALDARLRTAPGPGPAPDAGGP